MWSAGEALAFFVGERQVALWVGDRAFKADSSADAPPLAALLQQAGLRPRAWPRRRVQLWLSGALARPFVLEPIAGLKGRDEALAAARARVAEETGWPAPDVELWLDRVPRDEPALAVAVPVATLTALRAAAHAARLRIDSLRPWWSVALDAAALEPGPFELLASADPDALVLLGSQQQRWSDAAALSPRPDSAQCEAVVQRRATARGLAPGQARRVVQIESSIGSESLPMLLRAARARLVLSLGAEGAHPSPR